MLKSYEILIQNIYDPRIQLTIILLISFFTASASKYWMFVGSWSLLKVYKKGPTVFRERESLCDSFMCFFVETVHI